MESAPVWPSTFAIAALVISGDASPATRPESGVAEEPVTKWTRVETLRAPAILVVQSAVVSFLDVTTTAPTREIFRRSDTGRDLNSQVAIDDDQRRVFVTDGERLVEIDRGGDARVVARLHDLESTRPIGDAASFNWTLAAGPERRLYLSVLQPRPSAGFLSELELGSGTLLGGDAHNLHGVAIDGARRLAYAPHGSELEIIDFASGTTTRLAVSARYFSAALAPSGEKLLLSGNALAEDPAIAIFDVRSSTETILPISGSHAVWLDDDTLLFVRGESELLKHDIRSGRTESLFSVQRDRPKGGNYAHSAVVSKSRRLIAWGFASGVGGETTLRTIVIDIARGEYRLIDGWWHNVALLEPPSD